MTTPLAAAINSITSQLNQFIETTYPDECSISRPAQASEVTEYGSTPPNYAEVVSSIGCAWAPLTPTSAMEYMRAGQIHEVANYKIAMASAVGGVAVDIKPKDRVVITARGIEPERTFEVKGIIRSAGLPLLVLCTLEEQ